MIISCFFLYFSILVLISIQNLIGKICCYFKLYILHYTKWYGIAMKCLVPFLCSARFLNVNNEFSKNAFRKKSCRNMKIVHFSVFSLFGWCKFLNTA